MKSGLYTLTNIKNGKFYFGSSKDLRSRKKNHFSELRKNKNHAKKLQSAYNFHGADAFVFEIVLFAPVEMLLILEEVILQELRPEYNILYHSCKGLKGFRHSEESINKMGHSGENHWSFGKQARNARPVIQRSLTGDFIAEYPSLREAVKATNANYGSISSACSGKLNKTGGFKWEYRI